MTATSDPLKQINPLKLQRMLWPDVTFYREQRQIIESVVENDATYCPAGNMLGKDFVAGFLSLWFFLAHRVVRVVTTSVKDDHLRVLWGEIGNFIQTSRYALDSYSGGPLLVNHREIKKYVGGDLCKKSYLLGTVSAKGEGMAGHHAPHTLLIIDEASGVDDEVNSQGGTWAKKKLILGNPNPCVNFFYSDVKAGDLPAPGGKRFYRKIIQVKAEYSPNVRFALKQKKRGIEPTGETIVPGVLSWDEYQKRRLTWDKMRQTIGLDAEFYEGEEIKLFPPNWILHAIGLYAGTFRQTKAMGVDTAEGGDNTTYCGVGESGLSFLLSEKTPDTSEIPGRVIELIKEHNIPPGNVYFDQGGGGKEHVDLLRKLGYNVNAVFFGEAATEKKTFKRQWKSRSEKLSILETRHAYKNRRAELYHKASLRMNPAYGGFALIPESEGEQYAELYRQLRVMPKLLDGEGRYYLPPKRPRPGSKEESLIQMLGCSPDEADAFVLACWGLEKHERKVVL